MKTATRERAKILAEIANIPFAVQGKICENRKPLDKVSKSVCRKLLEAIITSEAAKADYEPKDGERNAGTKPRDAKDSK